MIYFTKSQEHPQMILHLVCTENSELSEVSLASSLTCTGLEFLWLWRWQEMHQLKSTDSQNRISNALPLIVIL